MVAESQKAKDGHHWILYSMGLGLTEHHFLHILLVKSHMKSFLVHGDVRRGTWSKRVEELLAPSSEIMYHIHERKEDSEKIHFVWLR